MYFFMVSETLDRAASDQTHGDSVVNDAGVRQHMGGLVVNSEGVEVYCWIVAPWEDAQGD